MQALLRGALHPDDPVLDDDDHVGVEGLGERPARPLHLDAGALHGDLHPLGDGDGLLSDARHARSLFRLPDVGEDLATDALLASLAVGEDPLGG